MARLVARIKVLPADADINIDSIVEGLKGSIPQGMELKGHAKEPIAFGLNAVVGDFMLDDAEGQMDKLEDAIRGVQGVGEIEVMNISRASVKMK
ncbi:elongation factor 1-beta [Nitrososphaera viennensis]|uniref:Elongation factor 1-beta n=2 Tax=Nitrososphaera viennensis TaxID=1034015 RepID=A0A060HCS0_9ARCH|nr:elongation factor 1-beta [Nitrososphaera viennensis]AIC14529.1 translation elongation factor EF-1 beta [Nitrososphaera viennensis EN76]UVS69502.1 elongation factor 1-beta [Nitrososphaera viennensis]